MRILIVEDEALIGADLKGQVLHFGYEVAGLAVSGPEAIRLAEETRPDLLLMDVRLKGAMSGIEAAGKIRSKSEIPVVYLTAYPEVTLGAASATAPYFYLIKPYEPAALEAVLKAALAWRHTPR